MLKLLVKLTHRQRLLSNSLFDCPAINSWVLNPPANSLRVMKLASSKGCSKAEVRMPMNQWSRWAEMFHRWKYNNGENTINTPWWYHMCSFLIMFPMLLLRCAVIVCCCLLVVLVVNLCPPGQLSTATGLDSALGCEKGWRADACWKDVVVGPCWLRYQP